MIPAELTLETSRAILRPVTEEDYDIFLRLTQDEDMWKFFAVNLSDPGHLKKWMALILSEKAAKTRHPFTIIDKLSGKIAGTMSILNISYYDLRLEIGTSWLGKEYRSTGLNRQAKYAMMKYVFEEMKFERVEYKTDVENMRARKGLQNIGGIEEGIFRSHMTMWNNRRRSSVFYSIIKNEWPRLKQTIFKDMHEG
jgi:RimJ/RimL family protein N-acetyltransferase